MTTADQGDQKESQEATAVRTDVASIPARGQYTEAARLERLAFLRETTGAPLATLEQSLLVPRRLTGNIENLIGSVEIPVGLAGPLLFQGESAQGVGYIPLATTEGALVASACRGARAISRAGGVNTRVLSQRMIRAPFFVFSDLGGATSFLRWLKTQEKKLQAVVKEVSAHAKLVEIVPDLLGRTVHVIFAYETGDAAGQNMTTTCTWHACQWIVKKVQEETQISLESFLIDGNKSSDKKVSYQTLLAGRGTRVAAEARLNRKVLEEILKVTPEELFLAYQATLVGAVRAGMVGYNINVANIIAAVFTATGQDIASVHESSLGQLTMEILGDDLIVSLLLSGVIVGTVGGGTQLPRQRDYLEVMGCAGAEKSRRFAEMIGGFCLALDLSTLSAIASGQFAKAHERLGRNRPVEWLREEELDESFFTLGLRRYSADQQVKVIEVAPESRDEELGSSIITDLTSRRVRKLVGHLPYTLRVKSKKGRAELKVIAKVKPLDEEVLIMLNSMAAMCGPEVASHFARHKAKLEFTGTDEREVAIYESRNPCFIAHTPAVYGTLRDREREAFVVVLEDLRGAYLLNSANDISGWGDEEILAAIKGLASLHSLYFDATEDLEEKRWMSNIQTPASMVEKEGLWRALADHGAREFSSWLTRSFTQETHQIIDELPRWWSEYDELPKTLVHNDFNPRNICLRRSAEGLRLCAYDWELATLAPPQQDLAELLTFVLTWETPKEQVERYIEVHRQALEEATSKELDPLQWRRGFDLALKNLRVHRFGLYLMGHTFRHYGFMERTLRTLSALSERK